MASSQKNPLSVQQVGFGCSGCSPAILRSSFAMRCCGSQNWLARLSGILARVLRAGERRSVASMGSHTTSRRSEGSALRCRSCSTAEAPRRQVDQVGERRSTRRGPSENLSKAVSNEAKFEFVREMRGSCPLGVEESVRRNAAARSSPMRTTPRAICFLFTSRLRKDDRR
jgi:hypothetical protein